MTYWQETFPRKIFQLSRNLPVFSAQTANVPTAWPSSHLGKPVVWDVTVVCTCADSYVEALGREAGAAAELATTRKMTKYSELSDQHTFYPVTVETLGPFNETTVFGC